jgi:inner membrane protein
LCPADASGKANLPRREKQLDNLTHGLVGAAIGKGGAERTTPLATVTLVLSANAPDVDVFSYVRGEYFALSFRRGITHGWPALILLAFVVTGLVLLYDKLLRRRRDPSVEPARPGPLLALSAIGVLTHPTLDWMNTYGMRWGLPFGNAWTYGDSLFIIDPWIWLALGGSLFLAASRSRAGLVAWGLLAGLASIVVMLFPFGLLAKSLWLGALVAIAAVRRRRGPRPFPGRVPSTALALVFLYVLMMVGSDLAARSQVRAAAESAGLAVQDVLVAPLPANPFSAEVEVMTETGFVPGRHRWLRSPRVELRPEDPVPLLEGPDGVSTAELERIAGLARLEPEVARYLVWSRYPYVRIERDGPSWWVRFSDARYDAQPGSGGLSGLRVQVHD